MNLEPTQRRPLWRQADLWWVIGLGVGVTVVYLVAAGWWGFWEPWETEFARMGRTLATTENTSWIFPLGSDGNVVNKPWLTALLLQLGYFIGHGSEFGMRLPLALLGLVTILATYGALRLFFGPHRSGVSALILATTPLFLMSAVNLAGAMPAISATTLALLAFSLGVCRPGRWWWILISGVFTGFSLWAAGIIGPILVLGSIACYGLWAIARDPRKMARFGPILAMVLVGGATLLFALYQLISQGFSGSKDILGIVLPFGIALVAIAGAMFTEAFRSSPSQDRGLQWLYRLPDWPQRLSTRIDGRLNVPRRVRAVNLPFAGLLWIANFAVMSVVALLWLVRLVLWPLRRPVLFAIGAIVVVGYPLWHFASHQGLEDTLQFFLYNEFLSRRTLPDHVTFDMILRHLGFAAYPYTALVPLAFAYLVQTIAPIKGDRAGTGSDDVGDRNRAQFKALIISWLILGCILVALTATLSHHYVYIGILPMAAAVGLLITDRGYWRGLKQNRPLFALIGVGCLGVLLVLTKDLRTNANLELGQLGPEILFEFLLVDGRESFPESFRLPLVGVFGALWAIVMALYFWILLPWIRNLGDRVQGWMERIDARTPAVLRRQRHNWIRRPAMAIVVALAACAIPFLALIKVALWPVHWLFHGSRRRLVASVMVLCTLFAGVTALAYLPRLSDHLSPRGLINTYRRLAHEGEVFYRVGTSRASANYYLGEDNIEIDSGAINPIDSIRNVPALRPHFCDPSERMFGMLDRDSLARAYYEIRHEEGTGGDCDPDRNLFVLDARSSRYLLVSNQLHPDRGEENHNPIAEHVFDELPDDVIDMRTRHTFDGDLELLAYRLLDEDDNPIAQASSGDHIYIETYWRVLDRVSSARQMFVHIDYRNQRINGDHEPVNGFYPINYWVPGEIVRDRHYQQIDRGSATGDYAIMIGFFTGDARMEVRPATGDNRVQLGMIHIRGGI